MKTGDEFVLILTSQQQQKVYLQCGLAPDRIVTSVLSLVKLSLIACSVKSDVLPLVKDISTAKTILARQREEESFKQPYTIELKLTPEQRELIKNTVSKDWLRIVISPDEHANISYNEQWKSDVCAKRIGNSFVTVPEGVEYSPLPADRLIRLPRGGDDDETKNTFGKGYHPTTRIMLQLMEKHLKAGSRVLDVGTGSGVLAVAAVRLGAERVLAIDVDPNAVYTAQKSVELNEFVDVIEVKTGSLDSVEGIFDSIVANLFPKVIIALARELFEKIVPGGLLLVSGVVSARAAGVVRVLENSGFEHHESVALQNWEGLVFYRKL